MPWSYIFACCHAKIRLVALILPFIGNGVFIANIQVRVDDSIRDQAQAILNQMGMDMTTAVRLLLHQIIHDNGYPFKPTVDPFNTPRNVQYLKEAIEAVKNKQDIVSHEFIKVE